MALNRKTTFFFLGILIMAAGALPGIFLGVGFLPQLGGLLEGKLFVTSFALAFLIGAALYAKQYFSASNRSSMDYRKTHLRNTIISTGVVLVVAGILAATLFALSLRKHVPSQGLTALLVGVLSVAAGHFVGRYVFHPFY